MSLSAHRLPWSRPRSTSPTTSGRPSRPQRPLRPGPSLPGLPTQRTAPPPANSGTRGSRIEIMSRPSRRFHGITGIMTSRPSPKRMASRHPGEGRATGTQLRHPSASVMTTIWQHQLRCLRKTAVQQQHDASLSKTKTGSRQLRQAAHDPRVGGTKSHPRLGHLPLPPQHPRYRVPVKPRLGRIQHGGRARIRRSLSLPLSPNPRVTSRTQRAAHQNRRALFPRSSSSMFHHQDPHLRRQPQRCFRR